MAMDHQYIDANAVAERYLGNRLRLKEREDFERHLVDCQECADRLLLAGMFHARMGNGVRPTRAETHGATDAAGALTAPAALNGRRELEASGAVRQPGELESSRESEEPPALFVRIKPLQLLWILVISAFLLVAIPALVWEIFESYLTR